MSDVTIAVVVDCGFDHHRAVPASLRTEWWDTNGFGNIGSSWNEGVSVDGRLSLD